MSKTHLKLVVMAFIWASSYPLGRVLAEYDVASVIVFFRIFIAFFLLLAIAHFRNEFQWRITSKQIATFILLGFSCYCVHNYLLFKGLQHTEATTGAVINGAIPLIVMALDFAVFKQRVPRSAMIGIVIAVFGTAIVVTKGDLLALLRADLGRGEVIFLIAIVGWAVYTVAARPLFEALPPVMITAYACLAGIILLAPAAFVTYPEAGPLFANPVLVGVTILQAIFTIAIGFLWFYEGVKDLGATNASVYVNLIPVFAFAQSAVFIGEIPATPVIIGGVMVIAGLLMVNRAQAIATKAAALG